MNAETSYRAWDVPTRAFHWVNAATVVGLLATGAVMLEAKDLGLTGSARLLLKTSHVWIGYVFAVNLAVRLGWAFVGSPTARWSAFLPFRPGYLAELRAYLSGLITGHGHRYVGHNPVARLVVTAFFAVLIAQVATGLVLAGTELFMPPFGGLFASWVAAPGVDPAMLAPGRTDLMSAAARQTMRAFRSPFKELHEGLFFVLLVMVGMHLAGVLFTERREGGRLAAAMFTGWKRFSGDGGKPVDSPALGRAADDPIRSSAD